MPALKDLRDAPTFYAFSYEYPQEEMVLEDPWRAQESPSEPITAYAKEPANPAAKLSLEQQLSSEQEPYSASDECSRKKRSRKLKSSSSKPRILEDTIIKEEKTEHTGRGRPKGHYLEKECPTCKETFATIHLLDGHMLLHTQKIFFPNRCPYSNCGYSAKQSGNVHRHVEKVHVKAGQPAPEGYRLIQHKETKES